MRASATTLGVTGSMRPSAARWASPDCLEHQRHRQHRERPRTTTLVVTGASTTNGITNTGNIATTTLGVTGAATVGGTLVVTGGTTVSGATQINNTLGVSGLTSTNGIS
jgi:hypothetical protein